MSINEWPGRERAKNSRQWPIFAEVAKRVAEIDAIDGLLVVGSFVEGVPDDLSDVDLIAVVAPGQFQDAWERRAELETMGALVSWDTHGEPDCRGHKWLTRELVKVECCIVDPASGSMELADPCAVLVGDASLPNRFPRIPPIDPDVLEAYAQELRDQQRVSDVETKYGEMKNAIRRAMRGGGS